MCEGDVGGADAVGAFHRAYVDDGVADCLAGLCDGDVAWTAFIGLEFKGGAAAEVEEPGWQAVYHSCEHCANVVCCLALVRDDGAVESGAPEELDPAHVDLCEG